MVVDAEIAHSRLESNQPKRSLSFWLAIVFATIIGGVVAGVGVLCGTNNCGGGGGESTNTSTTLNNNGPTSPPTTISKSPISNITPTSNTTSPPQPPTNSPTRVTTKTPTASPISTQTPTLNPTIRPVEIDVLGDQTLLLRHIINPINETVTVQLEYVGEAWVSFGFSTTFNMVPNIAVIGLPEEVTVLKYNMTSKVLEGVLPLPDEEQTFMDTSITQVGGVTTLQFTQYLTDLVDVPVTAGPNTYIWAFGFSNPIGFHDMLSRGAAVTAINECFFDAAKDSASNIIDLGNGRVQRSQSIVGKGIDLTFITDEPMNTLTIEIVYAGIGYVSVAFSHDLLMPDSLAVMAFPGDAAGVPQKWDMAAAKTLEGATLAPAERQTLTDANYYQNDTHTGMIFT
jgi:hypothetical protein